MLNEEKTLRALLSYVVPNGGDSRWNPAQFEELQLLALSCLATLAPLCVEDYMLCQGNTRILLLIEWCTKEQGEHRILSESAHYAISLSAGLLTLAIQNLMSCIIYPGKFKGYGNSFHGDGGRGNRLSQLRYSLRLLLSMCNGGHELITQDLHEQGAIPLLIGLLKQLFNGAVSSEANLPVLLEIQADILLITSCICEMDTHRKVWSKYYSLLYINFIHHGYGNYCGHP